VTWSGVEFDRPGWLHGGHHRFWSSEPLRRCLANPVLVSRWIVHLGQPVSVRPAVRQCFSRCIDTADQDPMRQSTQHEAWARVVQRTLRRSHL